MSRLFTYVRTGKLMLGERQSVEMRRMGIRYYLEILPVRIRSCTDSRLVRFTAKGSKAVM